MTTNQWQDEPDASIVSRLIAANSNDNDGMIYATWDELNRRGWDDARINKALTTGQA